MSHIVSRCSKYIAGDFNAPKAKNIADSTDQVRDNPRNPWTAYRKRSGAKSHRFLRQISQTCPPVPWIKVWLIIFPEHVRHSQVIFICDILRSAAWDPDQLGLFVEDRVSEPVTVILEKILSKRVEPARAEGAVLGKRSRSLEHGIQHPQAAQGLPFL